METTLSGIAVRDVMRDDVERVPPDLTLEELVEDDILRGTRAASP